MSTAPTAQEQFDERASGTLAAIYLTPDVVAQRDKVMALLAPRAGERALDIGCGPGLTTEALARAVGSAGRVNGIALPNGLRQAEKLPEPIFTPSTKAAVGDHDENIDFDTMVKTVGAELAEQVRDATLRLYRYAADYAAARGILLADTKFEFGTDADGRLYVMDEMLTPDSSRFWPADTYRVGTSPPSYDKQYVRDHLETLDWDKTAPGPSLPAEVIAVTRAKYAEALQRLAGITID